MMKLNHRMIALLFGLAVAAPALADEKASSDGSIPMFDGKSLKGWVNVNCAPSTFFVKNGEIVTTGKPTGFLRTARQYENFVAEFDWMHVPPEPGAVGNSGFFVWADPIPAIGTGYTRGIEVQVLVNLTHKNKKGQIAATSQGDLFSIWGATCVPTARTLTAGHAACRRRTTPRGNASGITTASSATTGESLWPSTGTKSPASANASRARATWRWSRKVRSVISGT
jgi:hypothetical protein